MALEMEKRKHNFTIILIGISEWLIFMHKNLFGGTIHIYEGYTDTFEVLESTHKPKDTADIMDLHSWDIPPSLPPSEVVRQPPAHSISTSGASSNKKVALQTYFSNLLNLA